MSIGPFSSADGIKGDAQIPHCQGAWALRTPCPLLPLSPRGGAKLSTPPSRADIEMLEGFSCDMSPGHCPEKLELPLKGQREGLLASLWPRAAEKEAKTVAGPSSQNLVPVPAHQLQRLSPRGTERSLLFTIPTHLFSVTHSFIYLVVIHQLFLRAHYVQRAVMGFEKKLIISRPTKDGSLGSTNE